MRDDHAYILDRFLLGLKDRKWKMRYEPLEIIFHLSSPLTLNHPWMHFDGLISHLLLIEAMGEDMCLLPPKLPIGRLLKGIKLPPSPIKKSDNCLYHASVSLFDSEYKYMEIMTKKFEDRWVSPARKIPKSTGIFKDYLMQHIYFPTSTVQFYVNGDAEELERLCSLVTGLGDNTRIGWGAVRSHEIKPTPEDWSLVRDGKAMRPIPTRYLKQHQELVGVAWKQPYWAAESVDMCCVPGTEVELDYGWKMAGNVPTA